MDPEASGRNRSAIPVANWLMLLLGGAAGGAVTAALMQRRFAQRRQQLIQAHQNEIERLNQANEARVREATQALQAQYQQQQAEAQRLQASLQVRERQYRGQLERSQHLQSQLEAAQRQLREQAPPAASPAPERPAAPSLREQLLAWGQSGNAARIPQASRYRYHPEPGVREGLARALELLSAERKVTPLVRQAIALLQALARDPNPTVRRSAIRALGRIPTAEVIPSLQAALADPDGAVVRAASAAASAYKVYPCERRRAPPANAYWQAQAGAIAFHQK
ncbi:MAG: hypothetical protein BRC58_06180 [Cyanobacteria bacterium QS_8_64_29]|nr:MAG: hypothetical protein BRC58_06180 [Cyanobacteria bacterium QS_8_64_29]